MIKYIFNIDLINDFLKHFDVSIDKIGVYSNYLIYIDNELNKGFLAYDIIYDRIEIQYIYVNEEFRNQKIATKLIEYLYNISKEKKCTNITLEVNVNNISAIKFYEKMGFSNVAIRKNYYLDEDGILMIKEV